jgi:ATP-dependent DNA ligase
MLVRSPLARDRRRPEGFIPPALLTPATKVPTGPGWIHELKHDGIRLIARKDGDRVRLWSRYGRNRTSDFAKITVALRRLPADVLIHGEAVAHCENGVIGRRPAGGLPAGLRRSGDGRRGLFDRCRSWPAASDLRPYWRGSR